MQATAEDGAGAARATQQGPIKLLIAWTAVTLAVRRVRCPHLVLMLCAVSQSPTNSYCLLTQVIRGILLQFSCSYCGESVKASPLMNTEGKAEAGSSKSGDESCCGMCRIPGWPSKEVGEEQS